MKIYSTIANSFGINGFLKREEAGYKCTAFSFLDKDNNPSFKHPYTCRGMCTSTLYSQKNRLKYYWNTGMYKNDNVWDSFISVYSHLNLLVCVGSPEKLMAINTILDCLNSEKILSILETDEKLVLEKFESDEPDDFNYYTYYKLTGPACWVSSAPIVSFLLGVIKFATNIIKNAPFLAGQYKCDFIRGEPTLEQFILKYKKSSLFTFNVNKIKRHYNFDIYTWSLSVPDYKSVFYSVDNVLHDYGANYFYSKNLIAKPPARTVKKKKTIDETVKSDKVVTLVELELLPAI